MPSQVHNDLVHQQQQQQQQQAAMFISSNPLFKEEEGVRALGLYGAESYKFTGSSAAIASTVNVRLLRLYFIACHGTGPYYLHLGRALGLTCASDQQ